MAKLGGINPNKINDLKEWLQFYDENNRKNKNIVLGTDGSYNVYDPNALVDDYNKGNVAPVKVIPHKRSADLYSVLHDKNAPSAIRERAIEKMNTYKSNRLAKRIQYVQDFTTTEKQLLDTIDTWKDEKNITARTEYATQIASLSDKLSKLDESERTLQYPERKDDLRKDQETFYYMYEIPMSEREILIEGDMA